MIIESLRHAPGGVIEIVESRPVFDADGNEVAKKRHMHQFEKGDMEALRDAVGESLAEAIAGLYWRAAND